jgi:pimeloyl-ACP methyl ester carboxylesterase
MTRKVLAPIGVAAICAAVLGGCAEPAVGPRVIFLDGSGWYTGDGSVRDGLRRAGFPGPVERFEWSSLLGPGYDHVSAGSGHPRAADLARRIVELRQNDPGSKLVLMGLSAGTSLIVSALERLPENVSVDYVVLLSPSISSRHDLSKALRHVGRRLYATSSPHDAILAVAPSAALEPGRPAGRVGLEMPRGLTPAERLAYRKVHNLPWRPGYVAYGWDGAHTSVTARDFIRVVIAPRILHDLPHPLDRPLAGREEA